MPQRVTGGTPAEVRSWTAQQFADRLDDAMSVYRAAFLEIHEPDPGRATRDRTAHAREHLRRPGVRTAVALDGSGALVGFCYAAPGRAGQWWHDVVTAQLPRTLGVRWLRDCLEVVELHVLPDRQGHGLGRRLLRTVLAGAAESTCALSALDIDGTRARSLYTSEGFVELARDFRFPGTPTPYVILARDLPAEPPEPSSPSLGV